MDKKQIRGQGHRPELWKWNIDIHSHAKTCKKYLGEKKNQRKMYNYTRSILESLVSEHVDDRRFQMVNRADVVEFRGGVLLPHGLQQTSSFYDFGQSSKNACTFQWMRVTYLKFAGLGLDDQTAQLLHEGHQRFTSVARIKNQGVVP